MIKATDKQKHMKKCYKTNAYISFLPAGSAVAVQQEHRGLWTHKTVVGPGSDGQRSRSYKIVMKTGHIVTRIKRHTKATPVSEEDYLRKEISKAN